MIVRKKPVVRHARKFELHVWENQPEYYPAVFSVPSGYKEYVDPYIELEDGRHLLEDGIWILTNSFGKRELLTEKELFQQYDVAEIFEELTD